MKFRTPIVHITATLLLGIMAAAANAQNLDDVLRQLVETRGGATAFEGLDTYRATGTMVLNAEMHGGVEIQAPFTLEWKRPNRVRFDYSIQGLPGVRASDGATIWYWSSMMGKMSPERLPANARPGFDAFLDLVEGPLVAAAAKGIDVTLTGKDDFEGTDVLLLEVTRPTSETSTFVLDEDSALPVQVRTERTVDGNKSALTQSLGDYKPVGGILFPHFVSTSNEVGVVMATYMIEKIEIGVEIDEGRFAMPTEMEAGR